MHNLIQNERRIGQNGSFFILNISKNQEIAIKFAKQLFESSFLSH